MHVTQAYSYMSTYLHKHIVNFLWSVLTNKNSIFKHNLKLAEGRKKTNKTHPSKKNPNKTKQKTTNKQNQQQKPKTKIAKLSNKVS